MKIVLFNCRKEEAKIIRKYSNLYDLDVEICAASLTLANVTLLKNADAVSLVSQIKDEQLIKKISEYGVRYISTRSIGYDHIDVKLCQSYGITVGNVSYSVNSVAEYTLMLILMALRKMPLIQSKFQDNDFGFDNVAGRELSSLTVGVIGTGRIGKALIQLLTGFKCRILAYDVYPDKQLSDRVEYCSKEKLLANSDVISLHVPYLKSTHHLINQESLKLIKNSAVLVNAARGQLIDTQALLEALKANAIGYAALDVLEEEKGIYSRNVKTETINNANFCELVNCDNVLLSPHIAFFTDIALEDMIKNSLLSCKNEINAEENSFRID